MNIAFGGDHAGFDLKQRLITYLQEKNISTRDFGPYNTDSCDYPDYGHIVARAIFNHEYSTGILICGSGNGVAMTANKHAGIRAALCWDPEIARLARAHNDANILCLPARFIPPEEVFSIVDTFLTTPFEGGRHLIRIQKINL